MLEHMSPSRRSAVLKQLLPRFPKLATHRHGSLVAQRALDYCDAEEVQCAINALVHDDVSIVGIACSHFGSYVIEQLAGLRSKEAAIAEVSSRLNEQLEHLQAS